MSIFRYGNTDLPANEVNVAHIDVRFIPSRRGKRKEQLVTWYLLGEIFDTGASLVTTINARRTLFGNDYLTANYYSDDSKTILAHTLDNGSSISGVHVVRASFPEGKPEELCTQRTYGVTLQATYPNAESDVLYWKEELQFEGVPGPEVIPTFAGPVIGPPVMQRMVQSGVAIGYTGFPQPFPLYPDLEDRNQRIVRVIGGDNRGQFATDYGILWRYVFYSFNAMDTVPTTY